MAAAIEHYKLHELADCGDAGKAYSTRQKKTLVLNRWVLPHWGKLDLRAIKTVAVEQWLRTLITTRFGGPKLLAGGTKEKIRDAMSSVFNHAIRWEFTDRNPITGPTKGSGVRVSAKRERTPDVLEVDEMQRLLEALEVRERAMVFLDMAPWPSSRRVSWTQVGRRRLRETLRQRNPICCGSAGWQYEDRGFEKTRSYRQLPCQRLADVARTNAL
jgi:integrase